MTAFDVIVIGSGPAGCSAALTCRQIGLNVLLVTDQKEKAIIGPEPLESIHPGVSSLLNQIGASDAAAIATQATYTGIYAGGQYSPLGADDQGVWTGMHIHKKVFNARLLEHVRSSGATIRYQAHVDDLIISDKKVTGVKTGTTDFEAKYVIDASGKKGIGGKKLNFKKRFFSPSLLCWTGVSVGIDVFPFDVHAAHFVPGDGGWSWFAPQLPDKCNWTRLSIFKENTLMPPDEMKKYPLEGKIIFANMRWRLYRPVCSEGILLCGDAAGMLDPAAGQGIFNALISGIGAAKAVIACLQRPDYASFELAFYDDWFVSHFEKKVDQLKQYYKLHGLDVFD